MNEPTLTPRSAAEWFLAINAVDEPAAETVQEWLRWLEASESHWQEFEEIAQVWHKAPVAFLARPAETVEQIEYDGAIPIAEWRALNLQSGGTGRIGRSYAPTNRHKFGLAVAASVAICALSVFAYRHFVPAALAAGTFSTATGEHRDLALTDGSHITLGGHSRLVVDFSNTRREIRLEAGEAYFAVRKDPNRAFVVSALSGEITAIGTAFDVRAIDDRVTVTVTEGSVNVTDATRFNESARVGTSGAAIAHVGRGEQISYRPSQTLASLETTAIRNVDASESARWREGWLIYRDETLRYVISDITRYTTLHIDVADSAALVQFSGAVSKDHIGEWLAALPQIAPVTVRRSEEGIIIASRN